MNNTKQFSINENLHALSLKDTLEILKNIKQLPKKHLGQNFLVDKNIVQKSIQLSNVNAGDKVVEVGPGLGTLTRALLATGCHVYAIEFDRALFEYLQSTFSDIKNFNVFCGNAVDFPTAGFDSDTQLYKVVANLPYNISTPWFDAILSKNNLPDTITVMLQKEAALRLTSLHGSKHYSAISIFLNSAYACDTMFSVARSSFSPMPKVDSVILHLKKKREVKRFSIQSKEMIRKVFTQRRKQLLSLIKLYLPEKEEMYLQMIKKFNLAMTVRAEDCPIEFWQDVYL